MKLISAVVRTTCLEGIVKSLEKIGIKGMTIMEVKGIGEKGLACKCHQSC